MTVLSAADRRTREDIQMDTEICSFLQECGFSFSEADIARPNPVAIQEIYEFILKLFLGLTPDRYAKPQTEVLQMLENPELYPESLSLISFCGHLTKMFNDICCPGFTLRDIVRPDPARTRSILYHATNFYNFRKQHVEIFRESSYHKEQLQIEREKLISSNEEMVQRLQALRQQRQNEEPLMEALRKEISLLTDQLRELKRIQNSLNSEIDRAKGDRGVVVERLESSRATLHSLRQDCNKAKSRIVDNPERLFQIVAELSASITQEKNSLLQQEKKLRDLQGRIDTLVEMDIELQRCHRMLQDVEEEIRKITEKKCSLQKESEQIAQAQSKLKDANAQDQHLKRQLSAAQEKIARLTKQQSSKRESVEERLLEMREEHQNLIRDRAETQLRVDANEREHRELLNRIAEATKSYESALAASQSVYDRVRLDVTQYSNALKKAIGEIS